jgi:phosphatidylglycerophosphatase A
VARFFASFFGSGLILRSIRGSDSGSGTVAAVAAFGIAMFLSPVWGRLIALGVCIILGAWAIGQVATSDEDPGWVVIDEAAGTFLATLGLALGPALVALAVFRLADIQKHWFPGVRAAERLTGGIIADDLVAGLYGLAAGWILQLIAA